MLAALLLGTALPPAAVTSASPRHECAGGAFIFFEPGSDRIDPPAADRLEGFVATSRRLNAESDIKIESGGDGFGAAFDPALSRRRSEAVRDFLLARGFAGARIRIAVEEEISHSDLGGHEESSFYRRLGWVAELVSRQEYLRHFPAGLVVECF